MIEASGQWLVASGQQQVTPNENKYFGSINSENPENSGPDNVAVQLNTERLKLIDEFSRLLLELKNQFPELSQNLSKARDYISVNQENIPIKNLMNLLSEIQQNLEAIENKPAPAQKLELIETIKNLVNEAVKILQPNSEIPPENKLLIALSQNNFASANTAIKNIVEQVTQQMQQPTQVQNSKIENFRVILNALQELKELGIPKELQKAPLKELESIVLQKNGIEIPKEAVKNIPVMFSEKPIFATVSLKMDSANSGEPVRLQITPLPPLQPEGEEQTHRSAPTQQPQKIAQTFEIVLPKNFPLQKILTNIPLLQSSPPEWQTHRSAPTQQPLPQPLSQPLPQILSQPAPQTPLQISQQISPQIPQQPTPQTISQPLPQILSQPEGQTHRSAPTTSQPLSQPLPQILSQPEGQPRGVAPTPQTSPQFLPQPLSQPLPQILSQPEGQAHRSAPTQQPLSQSSPPPLPQILSQPEEQAHRSAPTQQPLSQSSPPPLPQKIEMAFSLYQITPKPVSDISPQTKIQPQFILQPWTASIALPKEERNFWLKTDLPLTPQILNIREAILSSGKLPENPEIARSFASNLHEISLLTEHGTSVSKEQANLLWRVVQTTEKLPTQITNTLLRYQPIGNYEGDLFKSLPEPVKRELSQELPAGKIWQPETLQKAVEKILEKYIEQPPASTANLNEHTNKAHEEIRNTLQNFKEQIQWTRIDQDTRTQNDKENIFYFMHNGELQKGRMKIKDERKGSSKKYQDSSISFTIKTKVKNLGEVHADLTLSKNILNIRMQDEVGTASDAVKEERETLAKELSDIGITLGELLYGKTPKIQHLPVAKKEKSNSGFDVMA